MALDRPPTPDPGLTLRVGVGDYWRSRALAAWRTATAGADRAFYRALGVLELHNRQHGRCYLCGAGFDRFPGLRHARSRNPKVWTRDHVFPRAAGGSDDGNRMLAHRGCNEAKDQRWPWPCEVIYLAAVYAPPHDAPTWRSQMAQQREARRLKRLAAIERWI